jgi:Uma2 family endonuclease
MDSIGPQCDRAPLPLWLHAPRQLGRKLDYSDYLRTPADGKRYEILDGRMVVTPVPSPLHQRAALRLVVQLDAFFRPRSIGETFIAPIEVILTSGDIVQPDIVVVSDPKQVSERGIEGAPLLVVEILSASTRAQDQGPKARRYAELGVRHYWIVDPDAKRLDCRRLEAGTYRPAARADGNAALRHPDWDGLIIELASLWGQR